MEAEVSRTAGSLPQPDDLQMWWRIVLLVLAGNSGDCGSRHSESIRWAMAFSGRLEMVNMLLLYQWHQHGCFHP